MSRADVLLSKLVDETRRTLVRAIEEDRANVSTTEYSQLRSTFKGCCGLAQCVAGYALQDLSVETYPVATQSLDGWWHAHASLSVHINQHGEDRWFVVDPTFGQFLASGFQSEDVRRPAAHLRASPEGQCLLSELLTNGYFEVHDTNAALYLASFCNGHLPFPSSESFDFLKRPPHHEYHFRRDIDCEDFSRENLARRGHRIAPDILPRIL